MGFQRTLKLIYDIVRSECPRVFYVGGWQGHQNLGDEAIFDAFRGYFSPARLIPYSRGEYPKYIKQILPKIDYSLIAGGTLAGRCSSALKRVQQSLEISKGMSFFGGGFANREFWSKYVGTGTLAHCRKGWKSALEHCDYIGVRGPASMNSLLELGLKNVEVIGDASLFFARDNISKRKETDEPTLGINTGITSEIGWFDDERIYECVTYIAQKALARGWKIKWFVVWPQDLRAAYKAAQKSGTENQVIPCFSDSLGYLQQVSQIDVFVGLKLHSIILAHCAYIPSIMLEYRPKCRDHMMAAGQQENCVRLDCHSNEDVWSRIEKVYSFRAQIAAELFENIKKLKQLQLQRVNEIRQKIPLSS